MNLLKEIRFKKQINQYRLALLSGVHQSRISLIENDLIQPRVDEKGHLAKVLDCKPEDIFPMEEKAG